MKAITPGKRAISAGYIQLVIDFMQSRGLVFSEVCSPELLAVITQAAQAPNSQLPARQFTNLLQALARYTHDPDIVLDMAGFISTSHLGLVGYLLHACATLEDALYTLKRYDRLLVNTRDFMSIQVDSQDVCIRWKAGGEQDSIGFELGLAMLVQFARLLVQQPFMIRHIRLMKAEQPAHQRYQAFFNCPVEFGHAEMCLVFPVSNLRIPTSKPDKNLLAMLQQQADAALQALAPQNDFMQKVQQYLAEQCVHGQPAIPMLADTLNISQRTLYRRFSDAGTTFQATLDNVRQQLCRQYMQQQLQLSDIAQLLGYSDQSAFTRAFKRWTGVSPGAINKSARQA